MTRLDIERQIRLEPKRLITAREEISKLGYVIKDNEDFEKVDFMHKGSLVTYWVYSGWHSGKTIKDGRGLKNLLKQLYKIN